MSFKYTPDFLNNIKYVAIFARYKGKWIYCYHKRRGSYEHPGGHVEKGESALDAAKRELYEETGATRAVIKPVWDYVHVFANGRHRHNGRVYFAEIYELAELPDVSEMDHIIFADTVPDNFTYDRDIEFSDIDAVKRMMKLN